MIYLLRGVNMFKSHFLFVFIIGKKLLKNAKHFNDWKATICHLIVQPFLDSYEKYVQTSNCMRSDRTFMS